MKALIVDDERLARLDLRHVLSSHADVEILGEAANASEAETQIQALKPDVVFLDIRMPDGSGFDLLERLNDAPIIIFTTAYDEYALKAFEVNALDYLLKPIEKDRMNTALERVRLQMRDGQGREIKEVNVSEEKSPQGALHLDSRVFLRDGDKCLFVKVADIVSIRVEGRYVELICTHASKGFERLLLQRSLDSLAERLPKDVFFRANRNDLINLSRIIAVEAWFQNGLMITLDNGSKIEISRRQAQKFKEIWGL